MKSRFVRSRFWIAGTASALMLSLALVPARPASADEDYNFEHYASYEKGCRSIIFEDRRRTCSGFSEHVEKYCKNERLKCELAEQKKGIQEYKEAQEKLRTVNHADKPIMERKIRELREVLDGRVTLAKEALPRAEACVKARNNVQETFEKTIPLVKAAGDSALKRRQGLLDKLKAAEARRDAAKKARDEKPDDSNLRGEHEKAIEEVRKVEKELKVFNQRNGKDIARQVERLEKHYVEGKASHRQAIEAGQNHHANCKEILSLRY